MVDFMSQSMGRRARATASIWQSGERRATPRYVGFTETLDRPAGTHSMARSITIATHRHVIALSLAYLASCFAVRAAWPLLYLHLVSEDGLVESLTMLVYAVAGVLGGLTARALQRAGDARHALAYAGLALGMLCVAGEEISWGQRLLQFTPPAYFQAHNLQHETTLHNLVHGAHIHRLYVLVAGYAAFAHTWLPGALLERLGLRREWVTAPTRLRALFLPALIYFSIPLAIIWTNGVLTWREQEPIELLLALGFLLFVHDRWRAARAGAGSLGDGTPHMR